MVVMTDFALWTFRTGFNDQLGHGSQQNEIFPRKIPPSIFSNVKIVMVSAGSTHSMAMTEEGFVYCWGSGYLGQLGLYEKEDRILQTKLPYNGFQIVAANRNHSAAVRIEGSLLVWGSNFRGQLGLGDKNDRCYQTCEGGLNEFGSNVLMVSCCSLHTLPVTKAVVLWSWGAGDKGALGHDDKNDRLRQTRVDVHLFYCGKIVVAAAADSKLAAVTEEGIL